MKRIVVDSIMNKIKNLNKYDDIKLSEIRYGLEAIYLNVSRFLVFFTINTILDIFWESLLFFIFYVPLRSFRFGFHAKNSLTCWILSSIAFIGLPYLSTVISLNFIIKIFAVIFSLIIYVIYSPADTPKRPITSEKYRTKLKLYTMFFVLIYSLLILLIDSDITTIIALALIHQSILITPLIYKIFNVSYNNYLYCQLN